MKDNGTIIYIMGLENYIKMANYPIKDNSKME